MSERTPTPIAVTGALGRRVVGLLAAQGLPMRLVVRDGSPAPQAEPDGEIATAAFADCEALMLALRGTLTTFLASDHKHPSRQRSITLRRTKQAEDTMWQHQPATAKSSSPVSN